MPELLKKSSKKRHAKKHGFLNRAKTHSGKKVIKRRRARGRARV